MLDLLIRRFGLKSYFFCQGGVTSPDMFTEAGVAAYSHAQSEYMFGELLLIVIQLITEMPTPPKPDLKQRYQTILRRGAIHYLAAGLCTFSELSDALLGLYSASEEITEANITCFIDEVANKVVGNSMEPMKLKLKPHLWSEYDPCFLYMIEKQHNKAMDNRPKPTYAQPICPPCPECHSTFAIGRRSLLNSESLLLIVREVVYITAISKYSKVQHNTLDANSSFMEENFYLLSLYYSQRLLRKTSTVTQFLRAIQIITLVVHQFTSENCKKESHTEATKKKFVDYLLDRPKRMKEEDDNSSDNSDCDLKSYGESIDEQLQSIRRKLAPHKMIVKQGDKATDEADYKKQKTKGSSDRISTIGTIDELPSLADVLIDIYLCMDQNSSGEQKYSAIGCSGEDVQKHWLLWLLKQFQEYSPELKSKIEWRTKHQLDNSLALEKQELRDRARERALKAVKSSADSFAAHIENESLATYDDDKETEQDVNGDVELSKRVITCMSAQSIFQAENLIPQIFRKVNCIICHTGDRQRECTRRAGRLEDVMGCLALSQASTVCSMVAAELNENASSATISNSENIHLQFCGHAMHLTCFEAHIAQTIESSSKLMIDASRGQYQCPLCRKLGNCFMPFSRMDQVANSTRKQGDKEIDPTIVNRSWLEWPSPDLKEAALQSQNPMKSYGSCAEEDIFDEYNPNNELSNNNDDILSYNSADYEDANSGTCSMASNDALEAASLASEAQSVAHEAVSVGSEAMSVHVAASNHYANYGNTIYPSQSGWRSNWQRVMFRFFNNLHEPLIKTSTSLLQYDHLPRYLKQTLSTITYTLAIDKAKGDCNDAKLHRSLRDTLLSLSDGLVSFGIDRVLMRLLIRAMLPNYQDKMNTLVTEPWTRSIMIPVDTLIETTIRDALHNGFVTTPPTETLTTDLAEVSENGGANDNHNSIAMGNDGNFANGRDYLTSETANAESSNRIIESIESQQSITEWFDNDSVLEMPHLDVLALTLALWSCDYEIEFCIRDPTISYSATTMVHRHLCMLNTWKWLCYANLVQLILSELCSYCKEKVTKGKLYCIFYEINW